MKGECKAEDVLQAMGGKSAPLSSICVHNDVPMIVLALFAAAAAVVQPSWRDRSSCRDSQRDDATYQSDDPDPTSTCRSDHKLCTDVDAPSSAPLCASAIQLAI